MVQYASTNEEKVIIPYAPVTAAGNPAEVDSVEVIVTAGDFTVEVDEEAKTITLISGSGGLGAFKVNMDADLGEDVVTISEDGEYFVTQAMANGLGLGTGTVVLK